MAVAQTKAAAIMQEEADALSSHQVISLLLDGAFERVAQAKQSIKDGNEQDRVVLITKLVGIINGLRGSLNMDDGGDMAVRLNTLYDYIVQRLEHEEDGTKSHTLVEVGKLISEVKSGWDAIEEEGLLQQSA